MILLHAIVLMMVGMLLLVLVVLSVGVCKVVGHQTNDRVYSGAEYMRVETGTIDGIGREHATLYGKCPRCEQIVRMGRIHRPGVWRS